VYTVHMMVLQTQFCAAQIDQAYGQRHMPLLWTE
jgi:hypothetical protein